MKLFVKNMVCNRCKTAVQTLMKQMELTPVSIELGEVDIAEENISDDTKQRLANELHSLGFELIDDKQSRIISRIKTLVVELIHYNGNENRLKYSEYITSHLHHDYSYLSRLFSEVEGITIEQYIIRQKIEKAKELMIYDEWNISEIADRLEYSSVAHLSAQFKKTTGMTPTQFKALHHKPRLPLDEVGKEM